MNRIIFITPNFKNGGGNRVFVEIANNLIKLGFDVEIIYPNNSIELNTFYVDKKIKLIKVGKYKSGMFFKLINVIRLMLWVRKHRSNDIIILSDPIMSIFMFMLKGKKIIRFIQSDDYSIYDDLEILRYKLILHIYKYLTKKSYKFKNIIYIFNSEYSYKNFIKYSKRKDVPKTIIHPAINHKVFNNKYLRDQSKLNICIVGRKHPLKGFKDFVTAYGKLDCKEMINNVFVISHDDLTKFWINEFTVIKPKSDEEISKILNKSHIFVFTSWWDGFGLPPLEAMATGCAVITSKAGGVNEYAIEDVNCLMYEPRNLNELSNKMEKLILDKKLTEKLSENGEKSAYSFTWEKSTNDLIRVIEEKFEI